MSNSVRGKTGISDEDEKKGYRRRNVFPPEEYVGNKG